MPPTLDPGVEDRLYDPDEGESVTTLVKLEDQSEEVLEELRNKTPTISIDDVLSLGYVRVTLNEEDLEELCGYSAVIKVEIETRGEVMDSGFRTPGGLTL